MNIKALDKLLKIMWNEGEKQSRLCTKKEFIKAQREIQKFLKGK